MGLRCYGTGTCCCESPAYSIIAPNAFTPNNDGINDHFMLTIKGYISFVSLRIYDRYGTLVYTAASAGEFWDGNLNKRRLPPGVYYWLFDGLNNYNNTKLAGRDQLL